MEANGSDEYAAFFSHGDAPFLKTALSYPTVMAHYDPPPPAPPPVNLTVLFRFFPDGTPVGALQQGEVAIFQECNYQGTAAVFIADTPNLAALTGSEITLGAASVRLGNDTGIVLYTGNGYTGTAKWSRPTRPVWMRRRPGAFRLNLWPRICCGPPARARTANWWVRT
jgi:hypothetical protein